MTILAPTIAHLTPVQTVCNYATLWFRNVVAACSATATRNGTSQRFIIIATPQGPNNEGGPSSAPANGGVPGAKDNYLHTNPYPNTASPGQPKECEAGNEPYIAGKQVDRQRARATSGTTHREDEARSSDARTPHSPTTSACRARTARARARSRSALVVLVVACIGVFFGFTKHMPFTHGFRVKAVFQSANSIRKNSPVRIAGRQRRQGHQDRAQARHATPPS